MIDTSVLVAGIAGFKRGRVIPGNDSARLLRTWIERDPFTWLVSDEIVEEYREVLTRVGVRRATIGRVLNLLNEEAEFVTPRSSGTISPDPGDEPFCRCAEVGSANFVVTLNPDDFPQDRLTAQVIAHRADGSPLWVAGRDDGRKLLGSPTLRERVFLSHGREVGQVLSPSPIPPTPIPLAVPLAVPLA